MPVSRTEQAARNNAIWCDSVYRANGIPGEFHEDIWLNQNPALRHYPNAVTLLDQRNSTGQLGHIRDLVNSSLAGNWCVKDSFCALDLTALGFQILFEAEWIWLSATSIRPSRSTFGLDWARIQTGSELTKWETAWSGDPADRAATQRSPLFLPSLLADRDISFIAAYKDQEIVAGIVANRAAGVVGLSNFFAPSNDVVSCWSNCVTTAQASFQDLPLVGYERGPQLAIAQAMGFERLQRLKIWTRR